MNLSFDELSRNNAVVSSSRRPPGDGASVEGSTDRRPAVDGYRIRMTDLLRGRWAKRSLGYGNLGDRFREITIAMTLTIQLARLALLLFVFALNAGVRGADFPERKVTVTGSATIDVVPDEMRWTVQISINDATVPKAKARHDASLDDALKFIKSFGSGIKDLQTGGIRIDKNSYVPENSVAAARPFTCSTQFTFTLTDFDKYGPLCDGFARLDGVEVQSVDYRSSKEEATQREALKQALLTAHDKASDLATAADCYIDKPLLIQEGAIDDGPRPPMRMAMAAPMGSGTPSAVPGQIEITATVTASYDLFYK